MNDKEVLEQAIRKAIARGWLPYFATFDTNMTKDNIIVRHPEGSSSVNFDYRMKGHVVGVGGYNLEPASILFDHDFAKALWNEDKTTRTTLEFKVEGGLRLKKNDEWRPNWQYHLQQLAIAENRIAYLRRNA